MVEFITREQIDSLIAKAAAKLNALAARVMPTGGTSGQVLAKNSNTDYDVHWITPASGGGTGSQFSMQGTFDPGTAYNNGDVVQYSPVEGGPSYLFVMINAQPDDNPTPSMTTNTQWAMLSPGPAAEALQNALYQGNDGDELTFTGTGSEGTGGFYFEGGHLKFPFNWSGLSPYRYGDTVAISYDGTDYWLCTQPVDGRSPGNPNTPPYLDPDHWRPFAAFTAHSIPAGGTSEQYLRKVGDEDYSVDWADLPTVTPPMIAARVWIGV